MSWCNDRPVLIKLLVPVIVSAMALMVGCSVALGAASRIEADLDIAMQQVVPRQIALQRAQASIFLARDDVRAAVLAEESQQAAAFSDKARAALGEVDAEFTTYRRASGTGVSSDEARLADAYTAAYAEWRPTIDQTLLLATTPGSHAQATEVVQRRPQTQSIERSGR